MGFVSFFLLLCFDSLFSTFQTSGSPSYKKAYTLDEKERDKISSSILCLKQANDDSVISTAIVWDYSETNVLILTNYHTWVTDEFRPFFPPLMKPRKKCSDSDEEEDNVKLFLCDWKDKIVLKFDLESSLFSHYHKEYDFAILSLPREKFDLPRVPITLVGVDLTLNIHALGFIGHHGKYSIANGIVSSIIPGGFTMNLLSAPGFSGAAILADVRGRAVGYMGGNLDSSNDKNSQHQSYAFKFDDVAKATNRQDSPANSPSFKTSSSGKAEPRKARNKRIASELSSSSKRK